MSSQIKTTSAVGDVPATTQDLSNISQLPIIQGSVVNPTETTYGSMLAGGTPSELTHAVGSIISLTQPVKAGGAGYSHRFQPMATADLGDFLHRNVLVLGVGGFVDSGVVVSTFSPWENWMSNAAVADKLKNYYSFTGSLILSGKFVAPPLSSGLAVVSVYPVIDAAADEMPHPYCLMPPHVVIDFSTSSDFELTLPWMYLHEWARIASGDAQQHWRVCIRTLVGITAAIPDGCAGANLRIFARPGPDFQLAGPQFQSGAIVPYTTSSSSSTASDMRSPSTSNFNTARRAVNDASFATFGAKPSTVAGAISSAAGMAAGFPVIGPAMAGVAGAAGLASAVLSWFGMTRHSQVNQPPQFTHMTAGDRIYADGQDHSRPAALFSTNAISADTGLSGAMSAVDETSLAFIASRYTLINEFSYTVGDLTPQDQFVPVTPCIGFGKVADTTFYPTSAGFVAGRFDKWRGDMKYIFYPVVSTAHHGALQVIWQPEPDSTVFPQDFTNVSLNTIVPIAAASPIEICIGYNSPYELSDNHFFRQDTPLAPATERLATNGYLRIRAIAPLTGSICGQVMKVLVFAAAGENIEFCQPKESVKFAGEAGTRGWGESVVTGGIFQSGTIGAEGQKLMSYTLVPSSGDYPVDKIFYGERIKSVRALMEKPSLMTNNNASHAPPGLDDTGLTPYCEFYHGPATGSDSQDYLSYFGKLFFGFAGSIRYKVTVFKDSIKVGGVRITPDNPMSVIPRIAHSDMTKNTFPVNDENFVDSTCFQVTDITVPYYQQTRYLPAYDDGYDNRYDRFQWDYTRYGEPFPLTFDFTVHRSVAPDCRFTFFLAPRRWNLLEDPELRSNFYRYTSAV